MMRIFLKRSAVIALATLAIFVSTNALAGAIIVTPNTTLNSDGWALGAANMAGYQGALTNPLHFGPAGTHPTSITLNEVGAVNAGTLAGADIFISPWWSDIQGASSAAAVTSFFLGGGNLFLLQDDPFHDPIGQALGLVSSNTSTNPHTILAAELNNGSFGAVPTATQFFTQGFLNAGQIAANGGTVAATDAAGRPTIAIWDYGQYAPGAGRMVIMADVDFISTAGGANYTFGSLSSGAILGLNATEYLLQRRVPEPGTLGLLGASLIGLAWRRRRA